MADDPDAFGDFSRMHQKQITIHAGDQELAETGRTLYVEPDWTTDDLLHAAGRRLGLVTTPTRMFSSNGMEIADVMMIEEREVIFVTQGDDYVDAPLADGVGGDASSSGIPAVVGAYKVCEFLGKGGFGEVRVGEHQLTTERVALKFLRKSAIADMGAAERTTTEIQCLTALKHPNIIRLVQHINTPQNVVMVFELAEGGDLFQFLCTAPGQRVEEDEGRALFRQIVSGVGYAHNQHICHRDMKLDNVLLSRTGCLRGVKLADFGLSDFYRPGATMRTNCGSISYLAPEVFRGTSNAGPPLDVWSLGVIMFALLCGRLPFEGTDLQGTNRPREATIRRRIMECRYKPAESLSPEAKDLVRRMLKLDPSERASIPEIFNHSWLRFRNVTTLDPQPAQKDDRGGLRDAFPEGGGLGASPRISHGGSERGSPRNSTLSRASNSPRLAPLSQRSPSPPGTSDYKIPEPSRQCSPDSPRRTGATLDPLESKARGGGASEWLSSPADVGGAGAYDVDMFKVAAFAVRATGIREEAESKESTSGRHSEGEDDGDKKAFALPSGCPHVCSIYLAEQIAPSDQPDTDSDSSDSHTSRAGQGGRGRDFSATRHISGVALSGGGRVVGVRSSQVTSSSLREPMIRMNSRLGAAHPARSKTTMVAGLSNLTPVGQAGASGFSSPAACGSPVSSGGGGGGGMTANTAANAGGNLLGQPTIAKSRTMDLSYHMSHSLTLSPSPSAATNAANAVAAAAEGGGRESLSPRSGGGSSPRSFAPQSGESSTHQTSWDSAAASTAPTPLLHSRKHHSTAAWGINSHEGQGGGGERDSRDGQRGSLPPLSLPSSREDADRERERSRRHDRDRTSINHHGGGLGSNRRRSSLDGEYDGDLAGMRGDERKSVSLSPRTYTADDNRHEEESNVGRVEAGIGVVGSSSLHPLGDGVDAGGSVHNSRRARPPFPRRSLTSPASAFHARDGGASSWNTERDGDCQDSCGDDDDGDGGRRGKEQHRLPSPQGGMLRSKGKRDPGKGEERTTSNGRADKDNTSFLSGSPRGEWGGGRSPPHSRLEGVVGGPSPRHIPGVGRKELGVSLGSSAVDPGVPSRTPGNRAASPTTLTPLHLTRATVERVDRRGSSISSNDSRNSNRSNHGGRYHGGNLRENEEDERSRKLASDEKDSCSEILSDMPPSTGGRNEVVAERGEESTADCKDADIDEGGAETGRFHHGGSFSDGESDNGARPTKTSQAVPSHAKSRQHGRSSHSSSRSGRSSVDSDKGARVVAAAVAVRLGQGEESGVAVTDAAIGEEKLGTGASSDDENTAGCVSRRTSEDTL